jgi:DNA integrity scanning protein DisA with diadenylate cyclase activity
MSATVRKNFVFDEEIAMHLEELAKNNNQSMTSFVEDMIEEKYGSVKVKKRLAAFKRSIEIANEIGKDLMEDKTIQSIKAEMDV